MTDQARVMAHLRELARCHVCDRPATKQLFTGKNAPVAVYCSRHADAALLKFKEAGRG